MIMTTVGYIYKNLYELAQPAVVGKTGANIRKPAHSGDRGQCAGFFCGVVRVGALSFLDMANPGRYLMIRVKRQIKMLPHAALNRVSTALIPYPMR